MAREQALRTLETWHDLLEKREFDRLRPLAAETVVFRSPAFYSPYPGVEPLVHILSTVSTIFEDFAYHRQFWSEGGDAVVLEFSARVGDKKPDAAMIQIAQKIIEQQEGPFDPEQFNDRYEDALRALIKEKQKGKGRKVTAPEEPEDTNVVDLMEALRASLGKAPAGKAGAKKPVAKTAHKAPARKKAG